MKAHSWNDITVHQWQQITAIFTDLENTDLDMMVKAGAVVLGKTEAEIDGWGMDRIKAMGKEIAFLHVPLEPKPARHIMANGRRYRCIYEIGKMPAARYIEAKHFGQDANANLHKIAASMVIPQKRMLKYGPWMDGKYDAARHSEYAEDMLSAPVTAVLGSVVFFCNVYRLTMLGLQGYMIREMMKQNPGLTMEAAAETYINSCYAMDGIIQPNWSQTLNALRWPKLTI
jgi:hypothetical protein